MPAGSESRRATAIEYAIALVAARSLTRSKVRERLLARYDEQEVEAALSRLQELRLVDDAAWAERFVRDRFERGGKGRHRIRSELLARGIDAATAEAALAVALQGEVEREKAAAVLATLRSRLDRGRGAPEAAEQAVHRNERPAPHDTEQQRNRLFRRMIARGYPASLVRDLLDVS